MNKDWLWKMQMDALESRKIGSDACRLLLLLCKRHHRNLCSQFPEPFKLSMADAVAMLGYSRHSQETGYKIVGELMEAGYLQKRGVSGCPATTNFIISSCLQPKATDCRQPKATDCRQPKATDCRQPKAHHISTSFQEEIEANGRKSRAGEFNGSLRSKGTKGDGLAASPKGEEQRQLLSQLRQALAKPNLRETVARSHSPTTGKPLKKKT